MDDVIVRLMDMPCCVNGFTAEDKNGDFNIYINANLSIEEQRIAYKHEFCHIVNNDFRNTAHIAQIENRTVCLSRKVK